MPRLYAIDPRVVSVRERKEDREVRERLATEASDEAYMEKLRHLYPEQVKVERHPYELLEARGQRSSSCLVTMKTTAAT